MNNININTNDIHFNFCYLYNFFFGIIHIDVVRRRRNIEKKRSNDQEVYLNFFKVVQS